MGLYLYGVVAAGAPLPAVTGVHESALELVSGGAVEAVVSAAAVGRLRPERRHLQAHHRVVTALHAAGTVLPSAFGVIADSAAALQTLLAGNGETLAAQLARIHGRIEMGLTVEWAVDDLPAMILDRQPLLRAERDRLRAAGGGTRDQALLMGKRVADALEAERAARAARLSAALADACTERLELDRKGERQVLRLACLVERDAQAAFEAAVERLAAATDDLVAFHMNGPFPPQSFVTLRLG